MSEPAIRTLRETGKAARPAGALSRFDPATPLLAVPVGLVVLLICALLAGVLWISVDERLLGDPDGAVGLAAYATVFTDPFALRVIGNTLVFSAVTLAVAFLFGLPCAWLAERSDLPGRPLLFALMTVGLLIPGFTSAMGWLMLLHPRIGLVNQALADAFGDLAPVFDVATVAGMGWVQGLNLAPLAFVMTAATFRAMDPALEEAASMCRVGVARTTLRITLPLAWPGLLAAAIFVFMIGFAAFDVPAVIGWSNRIFTFSTYALALVSSDSGLPDYRLAAALAFVVVGIGLSLGLWYARMQQSARRYQVVTGKGYRPRQVALGGWAWAAWGFAAGYLFLAAVLPLLLLLWVSLLPYLQLPTAAALASVSAANFLLIDWPTAWRAMGNTALLMIIAATLTVGLSFAASWIVLRTRLRGRSLLDFVVFLPHVVPNVVFGIATLLLTLVALDRVVPVYGTVWAILLAFVVGRISYGTRMTNSGLIQIHTELIESARMSGAPTLAIVRSVVLPLLRPTLLYAWIWIALLCYRELTLAVMLTTGENLTLPVLVWNLWSGGNHGVAAALSLVMLALMVPFIAVYWAIAARVLGGESQAAAVPT